MMPETRNRLASTLAELQEELHQLEDLDEPTRALLRTAAGEIEQKLRTGSLEAAPATIREQFEAQITAFEASHPRLTAILSRVVDSLAQLGL